MWEAFVENANSGPISTGGPLGGGGSSKKSFGSSDDDEEDDTDEEGDESNDDLKAILKQCHAGDITADEAYEQVMELMEDEDEGEDEDEEGKPGFFAKAKRFMGGDANVKKAPKKTANEEFGMTGKNKNVKKAPKESARQAFGLGGKNKNVKNKPRTVEKVSGVKNKPHEGSY
jgi:hypothetical protein